MPRQVDVYLKSKKIDSVFVNNSGPYDRRLLASEVRASLINHDGYDEGIVVRVPRVECNRQFNTLYIVQALYGTWEDVTAEESRGEARKRLREYRENDSYANGHRIVVRRERIGS